MCFGYLPRKAQALKARPLLAEDSEHSVGWRLPGSLGLLGWTYRLDCDFSQLALQRRNKLMFCSLPPAHLDPRAIVGVRQPGLAPHPLRVSPRRRVSTSLTWTWMAEYHADNGKAPVLLGRS